LGGEEGSREQCYGRGPVAKVCIEPWGRGMMPRVPPLVERMPSDGP
jgi:hypothetical protein